MIRCIQVEFLNIIRGCGIEPITADRQLNTLNQTIRPRDCAVITYLYTMWMKTVSFTEFRKNASNFIDLVEGGEQVQIQRHGKVVARLVPPDSQTEPAWRKSGLKLVTKAPSLSQAIIEDRR